MPKEKRDLSREAVCTYLPGGVVTPVGGAEVPEHLIPTGFVLQSALAQTMTERLAENAAPAAPVTAAKVAQKQQRGGGGVAERQQRSMVLGCEIVVPNDSCGDGLGISRQKLAPFGPEVMLIQRYEGGKKASKEQCPEEKTDCHTRPPDMGQGKSEQDGQDMPAQGGDPSPRLVVGD